MLNYKNTTILAKDRYFLSRLAKELKGDLPAQLKAKKQAKYDQVLSHSQSIAQKRKQSIPTHVRDTLNAELPVVAQADKIIKAIQDHQVIIVAGETGSGKTTQLPKLAMLAGRGITGQIGHTQPRRLAARSVATRIADELGEKLGETVSFKVRFTEEGGSHSIIKLMTDGILLAEMAHDKFLSRYDTIIIDEAHERSLNIDFILGYLKRLLPKRPDLKVIITSATLDTARFAKYFGQSEMTPIISVEGRSYPVEVRYRPISEQIIQSHDDDAFNEAEDNLPYALVSAVNECFSDAHAKGRPHQSDILVFASTEAQIRELQDILTSHNLPHTEVLPLFARQSYSEQQKIFSPSGKGRRIIIATNVAETALTVPNIYYVIDLGFARISRYSYRSRIQRLPIEAISQASANQRKGRCGRLGDGLCIRLYSKEDFEMRPEFTEPEILRTNLASVILQMENLGLGDVAEFDFITPPDFRLINDGKKLLHELGAISEKPTKTAHKKRRISSSSLTAIGKKMAKMPIDPRLARMLIAGDEFACLSDMLVVVSALAVQDVRERPNDKQTQADQKHALFKKDNSDFLFYIELYDVLFNQHEMHQGERLTGNGRKSFAKKHYLSFARIKEWQKTHEQLSQMMAELGFVIEKSTQNQTVATIEDSPKSVKHPKNQKLNKTAQKPLSENEQQAIHYANLHRALLTALLSFVAQKTDVRGEYMMARNQKARIFPASTMYRQGADWVMAFEVVETSQVYLRCVAKIEPSWVIDAAKGLLKYHYFEPHWSKKAGRVKAYMQVSLFGLILVHKELVNYENIDLFASREIFIRDGLVANNYPKPLKFLTHNENKLQTVLKTEDKLRRRDLLVDEERLYQFYDTKIDSSVANAKSLEDWLGKMADDEFLYFSDEDVLNESASVGNQFPEHWQIGALKLPLSYVFDPSSSDDGVSVRVPVSALSQLDGVDLLWGIAGWRQALVTALLKTLPKDIRRKIVPIPDTASQIFDDLDKGKTAGLLDQLCQSLLKLGVAVSPNQFDVSAIDEYLKPLICVLDDKNRVLDKGRDLTKLQAKYKSKVKAVAGVKTGVHDNFPEHFIFVKNKHTAGVIMQQFCALSPIEDNGKLSDGVAIFELSDLPKAIAMHKKGVLTLIKGNLGAKQKQLASQIDKAFKLAFAPLGDLDKLKNIVVDATLQATLDVHGVNFAKDMALSQTHTRQVLDDLPNNLTPSQNALLDKLPLTNDEFKLTNEMVLTNFLLMGQSVLKALKHIYTTWQTVRGQMLMLDRDIFGESIEDIEDQLDDLSLADFIYRHDYDRWVQYGRYLDALKVRLDRLPHNLETDLDGIYALDEHMERLAQVVHDVRFAEYRWLVEEYRINLFAQPMKTAVPVSPKRLQKAWDKATTC
ncbi:ATP-dependent RNA helicase HrpA [Moraxella nasovis]|uniref:ATP-dependent RNA helicase HrpA n=1 Tax=Moraxella nasovis TaxID=2904121 RepID=UPI001F600ECE|nr:ATP-dependent RNA helicase HrpA [Moraxella nasovis]UNU73201.1 ATP-dependent RNA helicase HrpA [Moraxella nasovis]